MKHRFQPGDVPWNKGKRGLEAGWTPERRQRASEKQKQRIAADPDKYWAVLQSGPDPDSWMTGPDPVVRDHRRRWSRAKAQARFWGQEWTIIWEDYLDLLKTAPGEWSRDAEALNLARIDTSEGWHIWNVKLMRRIDAMRRPTKGRKRVRPAGLGSKKKGINWRRGGGLRDDT